MHDEVTLAYVQAQNDLTDAERRFYTAEHEASMANAAYYKARTRREELLRELRMVKDAHDKARVAFYKAHPTA